MGISFCVTGEKDFIIVDYKAGDVKVFNKNGSHIQTIGRKGYGPNEFAEPFFAFYNNETLTVTDVEQRKIFFYQRKGKSGFVRVKTLTTMSVGKENYLDGNNIYIAGFAKDKDGIPHEFFRININTNDRSFFLPGHLKYGLSSLAQYKTELFKKREIGCIGTGGMFDIEGGFAYYVWEGDLKILKINLKTKAIKSFGKKMPHYVTPYATPKLINAYYSRNGKYVVSQRSKMSYVRNIIATKKFILLFYFSPDKERNKTRPFVQFYTLDGKFIREQSLEKFNSSMLAFDETKNILYAYDNIVNEELEETNFVLEYRLLEK